MLSAVLKQLGFSDKDCAVYLACLRLGPSPVRKIAQVAGINRGTTYDILRFLISLGLVSYYHQQKRQYFIAEDPSKLQEVVRRRTEELQATKAALADAIPQLRSMHDTAGGKPVARFSEGHAGVKGILLDVIATCRAAGAKEYAVYSSALIREHLYKLYPNFTDDRIKAGIIVRVIALGPGGETRGLDERKWLKTEAPAPTYQIIYPGKLALITVDGSGAPLGVTIEDENLSQTQRILFDALWEKL
mgnify:CR=1 FL=1